MTDSSQLRYEPHGEDLGCALHTSRDRTQFERRMLLMSSATPITAEFVSPSFSATPKGPATESFEGFSP